MNYPAAELRGIKMNFYLINPDAEHRGILLIKMPFGLDLPVGATHGAGTVVMVGSIKMLQVPLWRSYLTGCILLGVAPCTAMVMVWSYLAKDERWFKEKFLNVLTPLTIIALLITLVLLFSFNGISPVLGC